MNLLVEHNLEYSYSDPVWFEPILIRLRPLSNPFQRVDRFEVTLNPTPAGSSPVIDAAGNSAQRVWFSGLHQRLRIRAVSEARTMREDPFGFLLEPGFDLIPFSYAESDRALLQPYLVSPPTQAVLSLAQRVIEETGARTVDFVMRLAGLIQNDFTLRNRLRGDPHPPRRTLQRGEGACRDFAALYADVCRSVGVAARFVSGYAHHAEPSAPELHAWCEVYLPGGGWRGFDPSTGLAVDSRYLALAAGPTHHEARPTWGTYRGKARSRLKSSIRVEAR